MSELLMLKDRVQRALRQMVEIVNVDDDGYTVPFESTMCWVSCYEITDPEVVEARQEDDLPLMLVSFWAFALADVRGSSPLFEWIATEGQLYDYGSVRAIQRDDGKYNILFQYNIAGDSADPGEIKNALLAVCVSAESLAGDLQPRFGGTRWIDS